MTTIKEVAKLADVSPSTVANVFSGRVRVREKTRRRVLRAADKLNYIPNRSASNLRRRSTDLVAFMIGDVANPSSAFMVRGGSDVLVAQGFHPLLFSCDEDPRQEQDALRVVAEQRVAGILLAPTMQDSKAYEWLVDLGIHVVCVDRSVPGLNTDVVRGDDAIGFEKATEYMVAQGHKRIAMLSGPIGSAVSTERINGYRAALRACGIPLDENLVMEGPSKERFAFSSVLELMQLPEPPTVVIAASTRLTLGVLYAMRDHGIRRPEQLEMVGSAASDIEWLSLFDPPVSAVVLPSREFGRKAAELLVARITEERSGPGEEIIVNSDLIIRS